MAQRLKYHFEPHKGWINDPNGLVFYKGKYHAFFQHYPYAPQWGQMHWGHAVSEDLIHWEELDIALYPDQPYENSGGCFSGSAIEKDGKLYLFYTSVSRELGQTQSIAVSEDGIHFKKYEGNPVIAHYPEEGSCEFRDPKVMKFQDTYYMVCGSGKDGVGKVLLFESSDLLHWTYSGVLFEGAQYGTVLECPDFFPLGGHFVLMFSEMNCPLYSTHFIYGDFDGKRFIPLWEDTPEAGPQFYAPQTFSDHKGRRIMIGWLYDWKKKPEEGVEFAGALTIPRMLEVKGKHILNYPVEEAWPLLVKEDPLVAVTADAVTVAVPELCYRGKVQEIAVLRDTKTVEVFINGGIRSFSYWLE